FPIAFATVLAAIAALLIYERNNPVTIFVLAIFTIGCSVDYCIYTDSNQIDHAAGARVCLMYLAAFCISAANITIYDNVLVKGPLILFSAWLSKALVDFTYKKQ
ncbi:hypothetical protein PFISCL1PPCAC_8527, partial [Pristionchus fissidentatus]